MSTNPRGVAQLAIAALAIAALAACDNAETAPAPDAGHGADVALLDVAHSDGPVESDATGGGHDAGDVASDANGDRVASDVDATAIDVDATPPDDVHSDAAIDVIDGDGGCACFPFDNPAGPSQPAITTSLECFSINARWMYEYQAYAADPCIGRPPYRREDIYANHNLIGVWSTDSAAQEPLYGYFYDATTKALVGAMREAAWMGGDPFSCSPPTTHGGSRYNRLLAGILPDCDVSEGFALCPATSTRPVRCPAQPDAGATDAAEDGAIDGAIDVAPDAEARG